MREAQQADMDRQDLVATRTRLRHRADANAFLSFSDRISWYVKQKRSLSGVPEAYKQAVIAERARLQLFRDLRVVQNRLDLFLYKRPKWRKAQLKLIKKTKPLYWRQRRRLRREREENKHNGRFCYLQVIQIFRGVYDD